MEVSPVKAPVGIAFGMQPPVVVKIPVFLARITGGKQRGCKEEGEIFHGRGNVGCFSRFGNPFLRIVYATHLMKLAPIPVVLLLAFVSLSVLRAQDKPAAPATPSATPTATPFPLPKQEPDVAAIKYDPKTGEQSKGFLASHEKFVTIAK